MEDALVIDLGLGCSESRGRPAPAQRCATAPRVVLFGAAPDTPNLGVSALYRSVVAGIAQGFDQAEVVVFDNGLGRRSGTVDAHAGKPVELIRFGARGGRRYYRPENLLTMSLVSRCGALGARLSEAVALVDSCDAVLDISGGDSFSDIYGRARFDRILRPKLIAISRRKPLILLPQTYGPYRDPQVREQAAAVARQAGAASARDADSFAALRELLGDAYDPDRHFSGVDMAFALAPIPAADALSGKLRGWLEHRDGANPGLLIGLNVSGLIYNEAEEGPSRYRLKADYREVINRLLARLLDRTDARIVLVPHVMDPPGKPESDRAACLDVAGRVGRAHADRVAVVAGPLDAGGMKWLISRTDWFCGTRMHSTIAALSSGVPTTGIAYSDKARGVFATCGLAQHVINPRVEDTDVVVERIWESFLARAAVRQVLTRELPAVMATCGEQGRAIVRHIRESTQGRF